MPTTKKAKATKALRCEDGSCGGKLASGGAAAGSTTFKVHKGNPRYADFAAALAKGALSCERCGAGYEVEK